MFINLISTYLDVTKFISLRIIHYFHRQYLSIRVRGSKDANIYACFIMEIRFVCA